MRNGQLVLPSEKAEDSDKVFELYRKGNDNIVRYWRITLLSNRVMFSLKEMIPESFEILLKCFY